MSPTESSTADIFMHSCLSVLPVISEQKLREQYDLPKVTIYIQNGSKEPGNPFLLVQAQNTSHNLDFSNNYSLFLFVLSKGKGRNFFCLIFIGKYKKKKKKNIL